MQHFKAVIEDSIDISGFFPGLKELHQENRIKGQNVGLRFKELSPEQFELFKQQLAKERLRSRLVTGIVSTILFLTVFGLLFYFIFFMPMG